MKILPDIRTLPGFDVELMTEFKIILSHLSEAELIEISAPFLQFPNLSSHNETQTLLRDLANNIWFRTYQPVLLIEVRLRYFAAAFEGQLKRLLLLIEWEIRRIKGQKGKQTSSAGSCLAYLMEHLIELSGTPRIQAAIKDFSDTKELRNAVSHCNYEFAIEFVEVTDDKIFNEALSGTKDPRVKKFIENTMSLGQKGKERLLNTPEFIGKLLGLKARGSIRRRIDYDKSKIGYQDNPPGDWRPITKKSPTISLIELSKLMDEVDKFSLMGCLAVLEEIEDRKGNGLIVERHCTDCTASNWTIGTCSSFTCWHCFSEV